MKLGTLSGVIMYSDEYLYDLKVYIPELFETRKAYGVALNDSAELTFSGSTDEGARRSALAVIDKTEKAYHRAYDQLLCLFLSGGPRTTEDYRRIGILYIFRGGNGGEQEAAEELKKILEAS